MIKGIGIDSMMLGSTLGIHQRGYFVALQPNTKIKFQLFPKSHKIPRIKCPTHIVVTTFDLIGFNIKDKN